MLINGFALCYINVGWFISLANTFMLVVPLALAVIFDLELSLTSRYSFSGVSGLFPSIVGNCLFPKRLA